jgi:DNA repair exonuclease SbcCD ATPase subunit
VSTPGRLVELELEAFRGFAAPQRIDLDADVVLLRGDNGVGKTSIADGLLWLITGTIPRLVERGRAVRKGADPIVNRYRPAGPARVKLTLALPDEQRVAFTRTGSAERSKLTASGASDNPDVPAQLAASLGDMTPEQLVQAVSSWGILQQHALLAALDSGPTLHQRLAEVVGLERVTRFTDAASQVTKQVAADQRQLEAVRNSLQARTARAEAQLTASRSEELGVDAEKQRLAAVLASAAAGSPQGITVKSPASIENLAALERAIAAGLTDALELTQAYAQLAATQTSVGQAVDDIERELIGLSERAEQAAQRAPIQIQLATAALALLGPHCPVCGQGIDAEHVRQHLTELLTKSENEAAATEAAQRDVAKAHSRLQAARLAEERRASAERNVAEILRRTRSGLGSTGWLEVDESWTTPQNTAGYIEQLSDLQQRLRLTSANARRNTSEQIARSSSEVESTQSELERVDRELAETKGRLERAKTLDDAAHVAAERIIKRALERLEPSFAEVYDRLSPHPTFTELRAAQDFFYGKSRIVPEVYDPVHKVAGNPTLLFSEGQLNVVALSYFLGLALNAGAGSLPFIVLDDPLQTMDVLGVLGFADLCRRLREERQIIVTTHDRRFASLLARKLAPREEHTRTLLHEFDGWTAEGPKIRTTDEPGTKVVPLLRRAS